MNKSCKTCTTCKNTFPATTEYFHKHPTQSSGLNPRCKICACKDRRARHKRDREKELAKFREYARTHSKEAVERMSIWKKLNPIKLKESNKKYRQTHKELGRVNVENRRARVKQAEGRYTNDDVLRIYKEQGGRCNYCGVSLGVTYDVDHIVPLSRGGSNYPSNLALACPHCNNSKGAKLLSEWKH